MKVASIFEARNTDVPDYYNMSASDAYAQEFQKATVLLQQIQEAMAEHQSRAGQDPKNWGFHGDMGSVVRQLSEVLASVKS